MAVNGAWRSYNTDKQGVVVNLRINRTPPLHRAIMGSTLEGNGGVIEGPLKENDIDAAISFLID